MSKKPDKKTEAALIRALENAKAFSQQLQENREKRLWKKVDVPCSLYETINGLTKVEMDTIRKNYDFRNLSSLRKAELASELAKLIPLKFKKVIYTLDQSRYDFIKLIIKNSGVIPDMGITVSNAEAFMGFSIIFPGLYDDQKVLFMPNELVSIFSQIDSSELQNIVQRNTEWIRLTHGLLHYYGVMDAWPVKAKISELTGQEVDILEFMNVMSFACDFYGQVSYTSYGYQDDRVFDAKKIVEEHRMRPGVDYYPFTKKQLLKAGDPDHVDRTLEMNSFISFLLKHYRLSDQETNEIALQITNMINADSKPTLIIQYLQSRIEFPSFEFVQQLTARIMELYNNTRQWVLKGHTPNELFQEERKYLKPLPAEPFKISQQNSKVIDLQTRTKVGRNDPCPCGSGKKYKKCCEK
ncbi:SEC-C metal-binding domain-containing protein [Desulfosporosinus nitroreducens]|uniref:SEC-C metal-binding domain-containing protein n=1 Tax=Desulfosporosinus nitroreducens TaxID=2018668 RepID=UPI00207CAA33|nr:SEC-C metal-binding domain-containing protein [Desulfosporosinus nitroreducens]MCO1603156.1 SEC-C metal-binding domain-containing protein [Desulfosporosinus nitroreducens]